MTRWRKIMSTREKRRLISDLLKAHPWHSDRRVAMEVEIRGVDNKTVAVVRRALEADDRIERVLLTEGLDGRREAAQ